MTYRSQNGGQSWELRSALTNPDPNETILDVAAVGTEIYKLVALGGTLPTLRVRASNDGGSTWSINSLVTSSVSGWPPRIAMRGLGRPIVSWVPSTGINHLEVTESLDGGQSWSTGINLGVGGADQDLATDPTTGATVAVWAGGLGIFAASSAGNTSSLNLQVLDPSGSPVTQLITNTDGWPTPNPLTVRVTLSCPAGGTNCVDLFNLTLDSPDNARFYLYNEDLNVDQNQPSAACPWVLSEPSLYSYESYVTACLTANRPNGPEFVLFPGQTKTMNWHVWIQPSVTATLRFTATWGVDTDSRVVQIPEANIRPLVLLPGFAGTFPPEHGGKLDPLFRTYESLLPALQQAGYELGDLNAGATLIPFGYDWRLPIGYTGRVTLAADIETIRANAQTQLKTYVNYSKVDLVAHSGGGLVARAYIEDAIANNEDYVNKLITLGAPHQGEVRAYPGWYGGDFSAFRLTDEDAAVFLTAVARCDDESTFLGFQYYWTIAQNNMLSYYYVRNKFQGAKDLLPISDVETPYLIRNVAPFDGFPYPQEYPEFEARPSNDFLEDLNNNVSDVQVGEYDVRKLEQIPKIITSFSSGSDTIEQYRVGPRPPAGTVPEYFWSHGEVITQVESTNGDGSVLTKSANLVEAISDADINVSNIELAPEHTLPAISDDDEIITIEPRHAALVGEANMVRRIISRTTGIDISLNQDFWDEALPTRDLSSYWAIYTCSPVRTIVTDPQGRRAGLDQNGQVINEIPGAVVTDDGTEPHLILLPEINQQFQIDAVGIDQGAYQIGVLGREAASNKLVGVASLGVTAIGQKHSFAVEPLYFQESSGQVVMEAENFIWQIDRSNRSWFTKTTVADYVGAGYVSSGPDTDLQFQSPITTTSPELQYAIDFTTVGTYHVWLRGYVPNAAGDSVYISIGDQQPIMLTGFSPREWRWSNQSNAAGIQVTFNINQPGLHTLRVWQREDGLLLDRIVLSTNGGYNPSGDGPVESNRSTTLTP